jgi:hypothetical protein
MAIIGTFTRTADGKVLRQPQNPDPQQQASVRPRDQQEQRQRTRLPHLPRHH